MAPGADRISVTCDAVADGWRCEVTVGDDVGATRHVVTVREAIRDRLAPGSAPETLVERSFRFLLEREPRTSILSSFELDEIGRYFPEYPDEIRRRMS